MPGCQDGKVRTIEAGRCVRREPGSELRRYAPGSGYSTLRKSSEAEISRDRLDVPGSVFWRGDAQYSLTVVEQDGPGHERAALRLGCRESFKFFPNAQPGLKSNLKFATGSPSSGRGEFAQLLPAPHSFGSVVQSERARNGEVKAVRRAVAVHLAHSTQVAPPEPASSCPTSSVKDPV